jgi:hypothetical protein
MVKMFDTFISGDSTGKIACSEEAKKKSFWTMLQNDTRFILLLGAKHHMSMHHVSISFWQRASLAQES